MSGPEFTRMPEVQALEILGSIPMTEKAWRYECETLGDPHISIFFHPTKAPKGFESFYLLAHRSAFSGALQNVWLVTQPPGLQDGDVEQFLESGVGDYQGKVVTNTFLKLAKIFEAVKARDDPDWPKDAALPTQWRKASSDG